MLRQFLFIVLVISLPGHAADSAPAFCYLPTESNVSYSQLDALPTGNPDARIEYGADPLQFGELWLPPSSATSASRKHPLLILVHGGCWLSQYDITHTHAFSTALAQAGYAVWAVEYRRTGDSGGGWPGSYNDVKAAIDFAGKLHQYPLDLSRVALVGHSAGGHLALLAGSEPDADFAAVIGLAAIVDIAKYAAGENSCQTATPKFMGGSPLEIPASYAVANPAKRSLHPETILIHGTADSIVPLSQSVQNHKEVRIVEDAGHFDLIHPATPAYQQLLKELAKAFK